MQSGLPEDWLPALPVEKIYVLVEIQGKLKRELADYTSYAGIVPGLIWGPDYLDEFAKAFLRTYLCEAGRYTTSKTEILQALNHHLASNDWPSTKASFSENKSSPSSSP